MAEFCKKCADELGFPPDLTIDRMGVKDAHFATCLCEGCGSIFVMNDGGKEIVFRSDDNYVITG